MTSSAFSRLAASYDTEFSGTVLGRYYRARVHARCEKYWPGGKHIVEINAGTGEDALFLASLGNRVLATDIAQPMVDKIAEKANKLGLTDSIDCKPLAIEQLCDLHGQQFDGLLSNFGGLNCIADFESFVDSANKLLRPGSYMILVLMGRWVPWEWGYFGCRGQFSKAIRRVEGRTLWREMEIYYPRLSTVKRQLGKHFELMHSEGLGIVMPPSYVNDVVKRHPRLFAKLAVLEEKLANWSPLAHIADHYLLIYQRRPHHD
ncbi:hypothetical protein KUL42_31080 [Alteromonas sp. KUL42]|uniref:class I SAM-dependent methyltransferase n=1 Tax=Alteromonas sp. KUL42 TaxID=2480797 RepID=UPI0010FFBAD3|nr:class I SAM-dependent methyltransferase [Alteromonas sp. KUL42]GEA08347.1 hypothetical protein KUL42_31080 [Alteromonas sp. KUL42]